MSRFPYNILMYSHDSFGLGHIRRTMAIARHLARPGVHVLILTGSSLAGRFAFPAGVDFVRMPGMIKKANEEYLPLSESMSTTQALNIRRNIIMATAKAFQPHLFIVDKAPLGLKREVLPLLKWFKRRQPGTKTILGLRDIMDDSASTRRDWRDKGIYEVLDEYYSEIWVYGNQDFYDPVTEYAIPPQVSQKMIFTGYIPRAVPGRDIIASGRREECLAGSQKLVVVTTGGGGDGYPLLDAYLKMLESMEEPGFRSILVSGPFMPKPLREEIHRRAVAVGARFHHFFRRMEVLIGMADLAVSMGGYNTTCEILSQQKPSLVVPREEPRQEQRIRAEVLSSHGLIDYLPWRELGPDTLAAKVVGLLENPTACCSGVGAFYFSGLEAISRRMEEFWSTQP